MSIVYVHVGLPKTGTTHLQGRLWRNRNHAMSAGLLYPGIAMDDHFHAAAHLQPDRYLDWAAPEHADKWPAMVAQMKAWPERSLVSHELFANAGPEHIRKLVDDLSFADEVHAVLTVRDLGRQVPSVWQENVKNQRRATLEEFVESIAGGPDGPGEEPFWEFQDYERTLADWASIVGRDRVHVVTVPARGTAEPGDGLWERFLRVLEVDPAVLPAPPVNDNTSLSATQTEFLRLLNTRLQPEDVQWYRYQRFVKHTLINEVMSQVDGGRSIGLDPRQREWAAQRSDEMIEAITAGGYRVVGSVDDLRVSTENDGAYAEVTSQEAFDAALDALAQWVKATEVPKNRIAVRTRVGNVVRAARRKKAALSRR
ncbi:sulfotransferase family protein [Gordonia zhaorongruii]|uniref:sulfotransferase family protein n=1 Tax=Gordonia zhaorongruii TaxID=2597659 RepID=UPI00117F274D|nr:sulfotransferase family protein [Gordonia zhaorongruii]